MQFMIINKVSCSFYTYTEMKCIYGGQFKIVVKMLRETTNELYDDVLRLF